jgi:hypothetical protein
LMVLLKRDQLNSVANERKSCFYYKKRVYGLFK